MPSEHNPHVPTAVDLEFYIWIDATLFYRDDFEADLVRLGADPSKAFMYARADAVVKHSSLTLFWRDYCMPTRWNPEPELAPIMLKLLAECHDEWTAIKCQSLKKA